MSEWEEPKNERVGEKLIKLRYCLINYFASVIT